MVTSQYKCQFSCAWDDKLQTNKTCNYCKSKFNTAIFKPINRLYLIEACLKTIQWHVYMEFEYITRPNTFNKVPYYSLVYMCASYITKASWLSLVFDFNKQNNHFKYVQVSSKQLKWRVPLLLVEIYIMLLFLYCRQC